MTIDSQFVSLCTNRVNVGELTEQNTEQKERNLLIISRFLIVLCRGDVTRTHDPLVPNQMR